MTRVWRAIRRIVAYGAMPVLGLIFLLFAIGFTINSFDEQLAPETLALLAIPPNPLEPQRNIYLALAGFDAPPHQSVLNVGQARIALYNQQLDTLLRNPSMATADLTKADPQRLDFKGQIDFCRPQVSSCWDNIQSHVAELERLLADNRDLYQRYIALHRLQGYYETARSSYMVPLHFVPPEVRFLFLADLSLRMQTGNASQRHEALADLRNDVQLWRRVLIGGGRIESKMVAVASLQADYLVLADMIADPGTDLAVVPQDAQDVVPFFERDDWKIGNAIAAQSRGISLDWVLTQNMYLGAWESTHDPGGAVPPWWRRLGRTFESRLFKVNATQNLFARQMNHAIAVAQADPSQFYAARDAYRRWMRDNLSRFSVGVTYDPASYFYLARDVYRRWVRANLNLFSVPVTYNPVGKVLIANSAATGFDDYSLRAYDGAALQRLVKLSYEIRRQQIDTSSIPAFLQRHPQWASHPVDGRPFIWNAKTDEITIRTLGRQRPGQRFTVRVWQRS